MAILAIALVIMTVCAAQVGLSGFCLFVVFLITKAFLNIPSYARYLIYIVYDASLFVVWFLGFYPADVMARKINIFVIIGHSDPGFFGVYMLIGAIILFSYAGFGFWVLIKPYQRSW